MSVNVAVIAAVDGSRNAGAAAAPSACPVGTTSHCTVFGHVNLY